MFSIEPILKPEGRDSSQSNYRSERQANAGSSGNRTTTAKSENTSSVVSPQVSRAKSAASRPSRERAQREEKPDRTPGK